MPETLSARALCSLADVRAILNMEASETASDDILIRLINSASDAIHREAGREFKVYGTNPQTRGFDVNGNLIAFNTLTVGDLSSYTAIVLKDDAGGIIEAFDLNTITPLPRVRLGTPITMVFIRSNLLFESTFVYGAGERLETPYHYIEVTGNFGWPAVPEDIRQAAIVTASLWYSRDVANYSETFSVQEGRVDIPRSLPSSVFDTVSSYRFPNWST